MEIKSSSSEPPKRQNGKLCFKVIRLKVVTGAERPVLTERREDDTEVFDDAQPIEDTHGTEVFDDAETALGDN